ncbi:MAG: hypothetical protein A3A27_00185 [Candidatus Wildermuthbacteria bacterium RIFCSPLOWO2_01_FULL_47_18]|uniref:Uncharacterized protein n=2 Tax=Candidatus Wildermuthiibacteriota TaxID=1817923 RepID=A0A1G2RKD4_9BACT|nr:MAG: hypothetical protein A3J68_01255 [Candidatus Wildermuthbacteria bacterium RIFCSPHIGHO2_02_FULL_48_16]OHA72762.1 MAG: hypothetical protein A3A27_00185 [Candidatus Wildermuthbacteria bacterium RIFCSPLOWO2_01_FULL_47_18]
MENKTSKQQNFSPVTYATVAAVVLAGFWLSYTGALTPNNSLMSFEEQLLPSLGVVLPIRWGSLGAQMVEAGVIDPQKFEALYEGRGGLPEDMKKLLYGSDTEEVRMTAENSGILLNLLWALGLGNKNPVLEEGPMQKYGDASRFASTGGWTLAQGDTMDHYSKHEFIVLTLAQQELVERASQNIYRPCCDNSVYFPDCNHGMAMLGLLELMASQGVSEKEMYKVALQANAYWFPDTYLTIAKYLELKGSAFDKTDSKEILGKNFSSASGYSKVLEEVQPSDPRGGSCGV